MSVIKPRTATVTIFTGDHLDRIRHIERQYAAAEASEDNTVRLLDETPKSVSLAEQHREAVALAEAEAVHVVVGALPRKSWRNLVAEHPVRDGNRTDIAAGVNEETFKDALIRVSVISPELDEDDYDAMADVDYDRVYYTAFGLNRSPAAAPKALASPSNQTSDAT